MSRTAPPTRQHANRSTVSLRPADQRFHSQLDWLDSWHSFSFGSHQDPNWMGNSAVLHAGEVQRMSAGSGIVHSEINQTGAPCRLLQIWIEPAQLGIQPAYEQKPFAIGEGWTCLLYTSPSPRDRTRSRMPSSA